MPKSVGQMTFGDAAYKILETMKTPLRPIEIVDIAIEKGYIEPDSKRPSGTMAARLATDTRKRFISAGSGRWKLKDN